MTELTSTHPRLDHHPTGLPAAGWASPDAQSGTEQAGTEQPGTEQAGTGEPGPRPIRPDAVLRVADLRVSFGGQLAVDGVSFSVERGEVLALVGESGSGKTVTAQAILGLLPRSAVASGSVQLTGDPARRPAHRQPNLVGAPERTWQGVRGRVASMVFQEPQTALNPVRTVGWQLQEALRVPRPAPGHEGGGGRHRRLGRPAARWRAIELLDLVGIDRPGERVGAYPHQLSGGQKQRVVIALALAGDPALLIADEPTTALDVTIQAEILRLLDDLRHRLGTAILLITHNMGVVADLADRVLVMRRSRMVERGEVISLFSEPFTEYTRELLGAVPRLPSGPLARSEAPAGRDLTSAAPVGPSTVAAGPTRADQPETDRAPVLRFVDVSVDYPGRLGRPSFRALDRITVDVPAGGVLGVVGESGSGKTTLARSAAAKLVATRGHIVLAGQDLAAVRGAELRRLRSRIGVVHQDPASTLDPLLTVGESVGEPLIVHRVAAGGALRARVKELLDQVALPSGTDRRRPHELSGGQRQRVALARALALRPELLIADEPTSALDVTVQARILALFAELQRELGFACLFISHDLAVVHEVSDCVVVLRRGRIVETGPAREVLLEPREDYTRQLVQALPVPDPLEQRIRRPR
ncbi:MAG TPA: ABC transporter ATP-binding protein [Microlunatus sp.]|nr:ABC transporter ATP-binding protein [Microlunatus sp.]